MADAVAGTPLLSVCTEPLLRIYTESCSKDSVARLLESARSFALGD